MASPIVTVNDLVQEVRSMLDEDNRVSVSDDLDILPALNRAQSYAANILARHYESPMLKYKQIPMVSTQKEYDIPEDAFEQRLEKVEVKVNNLYQVVKRLNYRDITIFESTTFNGIPQFYTIIGTRFKLLPSVNPAYPLRIWYLEEPSKLVMPQGRINIVNQAGNYIIVDSIGSDLTTESDNLDSYISVVDAQTGKRKASFQIQNIQGNQITFKTVPLRSTVLNVKIDTSIDPDTLLVNTDPDNLGSPVQIEPDDYICLVSGTCIPFFKKPFTNFLIEYAVEEIRRKLGDSDAQEQVVLSKLEDQVKHSWVGREQSLRIVKANQTWNLPGRRIYGPRS